MLLRRVFTFDAAHNLVEYHGKCERLHGHTYRMIVELAGSPGAEDMIVDFAEVKSIVGDLVISKFDHAYLNDILPQPSAENIARYAFEALDAPLRGRCHSLRSVEVFETAGSSAVYDASDFAVDRGLGAVSTVLFDFDLTLADTSEAINVSTNRFAEAMGLRQVSVEETRSLIGLPIGESWLRMWGRFEEEWLDLYRTQFRDAEAAMFKLFDGTVEALAAMREAGLRLGVVTNRTYAAAAVERAGIAHLFDVVVGLENCARPKPSPDPIRVALARTGEIPQRAAYVGDTDIDMRTAVSSDVIGVGVTTGCFDAAALKAAGASFACDSLADVAKLFGKNNINTQQGKS